MSHTDLLVRMIPNMNCRVCSGLGVACISIGLVIRLLVTFLLVHFGGFTLKEKLFIALAWLPKATVQVCVMYVKAVV